MKNLDDQTKKADVLRKRAEKIAREKRSDGQKTSRPCHLKKHVVYCMNCRHVRTSWRCKTRRCTGRRRN